MMLRGHQLEAWVGTRELCRVRVVRWDRSTKAIGLYPDPRTRHRLGRFQAEVHEVDQHLRLQLGLSVAAHAAEGGPRLSIARRNRGDQRVHGSLAWFQPVDMVWVEAEVRAAVLQEHAGPLRHDARPEIE